MAERLTPEGQRFENNPLNREEVGQLNKGEQIYWREPKSDSREVWKVIGNVPNSDKIFLSRPVTEAGRLDQVIEGFYIRLANPAAYQDFAKTPEELEKKYLHGYRDTEEQWLRETSLEHIFEGDIDDLLENTSPAEMANSRFSDIHREQVAKNLINWRDNFSDDTIKRIAKRVKDSTEGPEKEKELETEHIRLTKQLIAKHVERTLAFLNYKRPDKDIIQDEPSPTGPSEVKTKPGLNDINELLHGERLESTKKIWKERSLDETENSTTENYKSHIPPESTLDSATRTGWRKTVSESVNNLLNNIRPIGLNELANGETLNEKKKERVLRTNQYLDEKKENPYSNEGGIAKNYRADAKRIEKYSPELFKIAYESAATKFPIPSGGEKFSNSYKKAWKEEAYRFIESAISGKALIKEVEEATGRTNFLDIKPVDLEGKNLAELLKTNNPLKQELERRISMSSGVSLEAAIQNDEAQQLNEQLVINEESEGQEIWENSVIKRAADLENKLNMNHIPFLQPKFLGHTLWKFRVDVRPSALEQSKTTPIDAEKSLLLKQLKNRGEDNPQLYSGVYHRNDSNETFGWVGLYGERLPSNDNDNYTEINDELVDLFKRTYTYNKGELTIDSDAKSKLDAYMNKSKSNMDRVLDSIRRINLTEITKELNTDQAPTESVEAHVKNEIIKTLQAQSQFLKFEDKYGIKLSDVELSRLASIVLTDAKSKINERRIQDRFKYIPQIKPLVSLISELNSALVQYKSDETEDNMRTVREKADSLKSALTDDEKPNGLYNYIKENRINLPQVDGEEVTALVDKYFLNNNRPSTA
ncbi:MAG: hypothetical protein R3B38_02245 [Patescibacteria group bacterium]